MFVGRKNELKLLNDAYRSKKDELIVLYGRRRIGKSSLVKCFAEKKKFYYEFEALEGETTHGQINHFSQQLKKQVVMAKKTLEILKTTTDDRQVVI